jgi:hypothetical protein
VARCRFRIRPASANPLQVAAYVSTRLGLLLHRFTGRYGFNTLRRLTGDALAGQELTASWAGATLSFPALDSYCCNLFAGDQYEPEILALLWRLRDEPFDFVDGGANLGYWSVLVSGDELGRHRTAAIEASTSTFAWLERNRLRGGSRFVAVHAALHRTAGDLLHFDEASEHAARHVADDAGGTSAVLSTTVDQVVSLPELPAGARIGRAARRAPVRSATACSFWRTTGRTNSTARQRPAFPPGWASGRSGSTERPHRCLTWRPWPESRRAGTSATTSWLARLAAPWPSVSG